MADNTSNGPTSAAGGEGQPKRKDMVRHAMKALGADAKLADLQKVISDTFHVVLSTNHISSARGDIRREGPAKAAKSAAKKPAPKKKPAPAAAARPAPAAPAAAADTGDFSLQDIETAKGLLGRLGAVRVKSLVDVLAR